jgi:hypothetical protein
VVITPDFDFYQLSGNPGSVSCSYDDSCEHYLTVYQNPGATSRISFLAARSILSWGDVFFLFGPRSIPFHFTTYMARVTQCLLVVIVLLKKKVVIEKMTGKVKDIISV